MAVQLSSLDLQDLHSVGSLTVYADASEAGAAPPDEEKGELIPFLKEQQWAMEFATETAVELSLLEVVAELESRLSAMLGKCRTTGGPVAQALAHPECVLILLMLPDLDLDRRSGCRVEVDTHWSSALGGKTFDSAFSAAD